MSEQTKVSHTRTQYEDRVSGHVRAHTEALMARWVEDGRDDAELGFLIRSLVLNAYVEGAKDLRDELDELVGTRWRSR